MSLLQDYSRQAETYDETRSASPSVLAVLREVLSGAPGRRLVDIGGGTGNYARALAAEGWDPVVVDRSSDMLARAVAKGICTVEADAQRLPFADGSFDAAMLVSMLHHVEDPPAALSEACRVLRPGGRLAAMIFTREDIEALWYSDYFPSTKAWMEASHPRLAEVLRHLPGARRLPVVLQDLQDGSLAALAAHPELVLEERRRRQTSFFERLARDHPDELRAGLDRLASDLAAGRRPSARGRATVLAWTKGLA
jgi:demethylmenaquinone methyltransferase/2-methoxy-6-polyprenyl-1,4-benzoquinol methylase